ncbi:hypothetical protein DFH28DRAFT_423200 [Melampsora americana]|nr:hypothetical protein DFH28DRAFT_423200 [Melampsora americana]
MEDFEINQYSTRLCPGSEYMSSKDKEDVYEDIKTLNQDSQIKLDIGNIHKENQKPFDKVIAPPKHRSKMNINPVPQTGKDSRPSKELAVEYQAFHPTHLSLADSTFSYHTIAKDSQIHQLKPSRLTRQSDDLVTNFKDTSSSIKDPEPSSVSHCIKDGHVTDTGVTYRDKISSMPQTTLSDREHSTNKISPSLVDDSNLGVLVFCRGKVKPFEGLSPSEVVEKVNKVLSQIQVTIKDKPIRVVGAKFYDTGSVKLLASNHLAAEWLKSNKDEWIPKADERLKIVKSRHAVILTNLPAFYSSHKRFVKQICQKNGIHPQDILEIKYSTKSTSMMIVTPNLNLVDQIEKEGLLINGSRVNGHKYESFKEECEHCLTLGHHYGRCGKRAFCEWCGGDHWGAECSMDIKNRNHEFCYVCQRQYLKSSPNSQIDKNDQRFHHSRHSNTCPVKLYGKNRIASYEGCLNSEDHQGI